MRTSFASLRGVLALLLIGSGILFLVGSTIERSHRHHQATPAAQSETTETGHEAHSETGAKILGVDTESLALSVVAVLLSLALAVGVWLGRWPRLVLLAVLGFGLVFTAGDGREVVHQLDESNNGLAAVAAVLIGLHVAVAGLAVLLLRRQPASGVAIGELT